MAGPWPSPPPFKNNISLHLKLHWNESAKPVATEGFKFKMERYCRTECAPPDL